jgi:peptidyl-prolyl cis-trans isomerase B (cyclophilin B)
MDRIDIHVEVPRVEYEKLSETRQGESSETVSLRVEAARQIQREQLSKQLAILETSLGAITIEFSPEKAPNHVRNFLRLASAGVYDRMTVHRVVPGFMIQTGFLGSKQILMDDSQQQLVRNLQPEFNDTIHDKGIVSMARLDDPASANTSFFIVTARVSALDGKYTAFGRVVDGMSVVEAIEQVPRDGEAPRTRIDLVRVRVEQK